MRRIGVRLARRLLRTKLGYRLRNFVVREALSNVESIVHQSTVMRLSSPSARVEWRNRTFSWKEPETLEWIDGFSQSAILWDVGANVGLYTVYAALGKSQVVAFEPSPFNLELLARNVNLNDLQELVTIVPLAIGPSGHPNSKLSGENMDWGHSQNQFRQNLNTGGIGDSPWQIKTIGLPLDDVVSLFELPSPSHIKIDVDGIELQILESAGEVLRSVESVLVEINGVEEGRRIGEVLTHAGLKLAGSGRVNQIWNRS